MRQFPPQLRRCRPGRRAAFTLLETMMVVAIIGVLAAFAVPSFQQSIQQSHADRAGANLQAVWSAQRIYWLENRAYAATLDELVQLQLVDANVLRDKQFSYAISSADRSSFTAVATRVGSTRWSGEFSIDESGILTGGVSKLTKTTGDTINTLTTTTSEETVLVPGYQ